MTTLTPTQIEARRENIKRLIHSAGATIFGIDFVKKDRSVRTVQVHLPKAKFEVVGDDAGEAQKKARETRKANNPHLFNVWDVANQGFRSVNLDTVFGVTVRGTRYDVGPAVAA